MELVHPIRLQEDGIQSHTHRWKRCNPNCNRDGSIRLQGIAILLPRPLVGLPDPFGVLTSIDSE
eukprot:6058116-Prorocentrum_lima.AAC.1